MTPTNRRFFILQVAGAATALSVAAAHAQSGGPKLAETDPQAMALGYKEDVSQVDASKYPQFKPGQNCLNCVLYQGKPGDEAGPCPIFVGKSVKAAGWCASYAPKPPAAAPTAPAAPAQTAPSPKAPAEPAKPAE